MQPKRRRMFAALLIILEVTYITADDLHTKVETRDAHALVEGTSTGSISAASPTCPVTADDFGPVVPGKVTSACTLSNGTNLQEFCSNCLCTIYSIAAQSLGNTSIPPNNETAGELYAELFGPNPELFYSSSMAACDPLVVSVLTAAGAFPTSSWRGVDTCMSLSASRGLLDFSHYGASCSLRENIQLKVAAASSGASLLSTGYLLLSLGLAALGSVMLGWI